MADNWNEFKEHAVKSGLGVALCYKLASESKYHIICAVESIPSVYGTPNTIEFSTTTNKSITNIKGKNTAENPEVVFPLNRDTINIMNKICDIEVDYAIIDLEDGTGWKFTGVGSYRMNEISADSVKTGTLAIAVSNVDDRASKDLLDLYMDTCTFENIIPTRVDLDSTGSTSTINVVVEPSGATVTATSGSTSIATATYSAGVLTITRVAAGNTTVTIKVTSTNYADNEREILVVCN